jgi:hypothetical protein
MRTKSGSRTRSGRRRWGGLLVIVLGTAVARSEQKIPPVPIGLLAPREGRKSANPFPGFFWNEHPEAFQDVGKPVEYEVQIASDPRFADLVDEDRVALNRSVHDEPLASGSYYTGKWRGVPTVATRRIEVLRWSSSSTLQVSTQLVLSVLTPASSMDGIGPWVLIVPPGGVVAENNQLGGTGIRELNAGRNRG